MRFAPPLRRAASLGLALGLVGCDIIDLAQSNTPIFEQSWNLPAKGTTIWVSSLLPNGVTILPDSSAFRVDINAIQINRRVGTDCSVCEGLNGTNAVKPAFRLTAGNSEPLPQDMVAGGVLGGDMTVSLTNNMSFDPLYVRTGPPPQQQGYLLIVVRSGSLVLGRDSIHGDATVSADGKSRPWPAGTQITRTVPLATGVVNTNMTVDIIVDSPLGDHNELINSNGTLNATANLDDANAQPTLRVGSMTMNVVNKAMTSTAGDSLPLDGLEGGITDNVVSGTLHMSITNPFAIVGNVDVNFGYGPGLAVTKTFPMPTGVDQLRSVDLTNAEIRNLLGKKVGLSIGGGVNSTAPITVTPKQIVSFTNRLGLVLHVGGK